VTRATAIALLDQADAALRPRAERGDRRAVTTMLKIIEWRAVLNGLATTGGR
jgi:hypothetical protein